MQENRRTPWELQKEFDEYVAQQNKRIKLRHSLRLWLRVLVCVGIVILVGTLWDTVIEPDGAGSRFHPPIMSSLYSLIALTCPLLIVNIAISSLFSSMEGRIRYWIREKEKKIEKEIDAYNEEQRRQEAIERDRQEAERKHKEEAEAAERRRKQEAERLAVEQQKRELRERLHREELAADERMSQSELVHEIARCILPTFKQIVENVDTEAHMKVHVRLVLEVREDTIDYYDFSVPQNRSRFLFREEGIEEKLSPILRKALCKALVTELRLLILEAFPIDPERKMVQADLEGSVVLKSNITYVPERDYTALEYDANSHAYAVILYQASKDKGPRRF